MSKKIVKPILSLFCPEIKTMFFQMIKMNFAFNYAS